MITTNIQYEITDTYAGEANYSWVKRGKIECKPGEEYSDLATVRRVKAALGLQGVKCKRKVFEDMIALYPVGECTVVFITFHSFGCAS